MVNRSLALPRMMTFRAGFTIIESLIVLVILAILSIVLVALLKYEEPEPPGPSPESPVPKAATAER